MKIRRAAEAERRRREERLIEETKRRQARVLAQLRVLIPAAEERANGYGSTA